MTDPVSQWTRLMQWIYLVLVSWQVVWFALLPLPLGPKNWWLAGLAVTPLLIPLWGLLQRKYRSLIWAGVLTTVYFTVGVMEMWSNPPQRVAATVQILLTVAYLFAFRKRNQNA